MAIYHQNFFKKLIRDYFEFIKAPKAFVQAQLNDFNVESVDKKLIFFVVFMHMYYFFSPAFLLGTNLISLIIVFFSGGLFYYLSQVCLDHYQERVDELGYDSKKLYVFAYALSLAELTGLLLNLIILAFNLTQIFSFIAWLMSFFLMLPVLILVVVLKLSIFKVVEPSELSIITFMKFFLEAAIATVKNNFALDAWKELWADFQNIED